ncbi:MAG: hypothetical protein Q8L63_01940, partial [Alphaproteobacteria bacterium]|nr:hypothetical protein [Alphaproteobacteria bacterium]
MFKRFLLGTAGVMVAAGMASTASNAKVIDAFTTGPQEMLLRKGTAQSFSITGKLLDNAPGCALVPNAAACVGSGTV